MRSLLLFIAALAVGAVVAFGADQGGTPKYPVTNRELAARNYVEYVVADVTPTASVVTFTTKTKHLRIHNAGTGSCVINVGGGTPTATSGGMLLPSGITYSEDFTTTSVGVIGVAASPTVWFEAQH